MAEVEFPQNYDGTATPAVHHANEIAQEQIREHIMRTNDMRLFSLLHLLGQASLRMEQVLWPEEFERIRREVEKAIKEADSPDAKWHSHEDVIQAIQQKIDAMKSKPC
jgi:hypothetical protein